MTTIPIHIPKTGGQSMLDSVAGWNKRRGHRTYREKERRAKEACCYAAFIRCPYDRAVSIYCYLQQSTGVNFSGPNFTRHSPSHRAFREIIRIGFPTADDMWKEVRPAEIGHLIPHFRPQMRWIRGSHVGKNMFLYDFSDFENELDRMCKERDLQRIRTGVVKKKSARKTAAEELSPEARENIRKHYAIDFELLKSQKFLPTIDE